MDLTGRNIGNYVVTSRLGGGGMGTVYVCEHPLLKRRVALKVLHEEHARDPATVDRFFHEAKAANDIHHPNIVDVYDFGTMPAVGSEPPVVYLIMELLEGRSLAAALPGLTTEEAIHVVRQCCRALAASHDKGIVHRDIKPENIFLVRHEGDPLFVKIVDFGIAKLLRPGEGGRTQMGTVIGTPCYMSPEQCEGMGRVDHRADIYSLGIVLYEMVTKRLPFVGDTFSAIVIGHMTQPPPPPSQVRAGVSPEIEAIILHALEKDPARRFQSMAELGAALDDPAAHLIAYRAERVQQPTLQAARSGRTLVLGATSPAPADASTAQHAAGEVFALATPARGRSAATPWIVAGAGVVIAAALALGVSVALRDRASLTEAPPSPPVETRAAAPPFIPPPIATNPPPGATATVTIMVAASQPERGSRGSIAVASSSV
jgi:serine/threonine-protein kinase